MVKGVHVKAVQSQWKLNPKIPLPPELFRNVISFLTSTEDLLNLALTSQLCRSEAERILYRTIDLAEDSGTPPLWARTIINNHNKAMEVRSLTIRFDLSFLLVPSLVLPSLVLIAKALRMLQNLKVLKLFGHPTAMMHPLCSWLLDDCTFKLEVFENEVLPPSSITPFILEQKHLQSWVQTGVFKRALPEDFLPPQLTDFEAHVSALQHISSTRPLRQLHLTLDQENLLGVGSLRDKERETIKSLGLFGMTLTSLVIEHKVIGTDTDNHLRSDEVLSLLAECTPNLTFLSYQTTLTYPCPFTTAFNFSPNSNSAIHNMPSFNHSQAQTLPPRPNVGTDNQTQYSTPISQLSQLVMLILPLPSAAGNQSRKHSRKLSVRHIADGILAASPSLQELSFVGDRREYTFVKTQRKVE